MILTDITEAIGNTPLLRLDSAYYGLRNIDLYVKLEYLNPFGSVKDRTAVGLTRQADLTAMRARGQALIESSSGNTAKALQVLANRHNIPFVSVTNRIKIPEVEQQLRYLGTELVSLPGRSECPDPNDSDNAIAVIERRVAADPDRYVHTSQYTNPANPLVHEQTTAQEIYRDLPDLDVFVAGIGTGGSSGGVVDYAKKAGKATQFIGVVSHPSDFLPGIRNRAELFETALFDHQKYDHISEVTALDALDALHELVHHDGVLAGPTTGGNLVAALEWARQYDRDHPDGPRASVALLACDRLETYFSYIERRRPFMAGQARPATPTAITDRDLAEVSKPCDQATLDWLSQSDALVVDTRSAKAFGLFHIEGAVCYPEQYLDELLASAAPFDRQRPLLITCPRGDRSGYLAVRLRRQGFDAWHLAGGLRQWRNAGLPFVRRTGHGQG